MRIAGTIQESVVDGEGYRFVVFCQGCPHHCEGCHNPQTWDYDGGREVDTIDLIPDMLSNPLTDGVTLSGGEPFEQPYDCYELARAAKKNGLNVWCYTGYKFETLLHKYGDTQLLLSAIDVLVDGRFEQDKKSYNCKWRGSTNQRLIDVPNSLIKGEVVLYG